MSGTYPEVDKSMLQSNILNLLQRPKTEELVHRYFNPKHEEPFAGSLFDTLGDNRPERFGIDDLLALNLLDEPVNAYQVKRITSGEFDNLLSEICDKSDVTALAGQHYEKAIELWEALRDVKGFGPTRISKLLARKRPKLLPIRDSVVNEILGITGFSWWRALSDSFRDSEITEVLRSFNPSANVKPSLLRVLDVAVWMHGSRSRAAKKVRLEFCVPDPSNRASRIRRN